MTKLPKVTPKKAIKKLQKAGLLLDRIKGSHHILRSPDGQKYASVPMHNRPLKKGTLYNIIKGVQLTVEEFIKL